jgi:hypothetical protein
MKDTQWRDEGEATKLEDGARSGRSSPRASTPRLGRPARGRVLLRRRRGRRVVVDVAAAAVPKSVEPLQPSVL